MLPIFAALLVLASAVQSDQPPAGPTVHEITVWAAAAEPADRYRLTLHPTRRVDRDGGNLYRTAFELFDARWDRDPLLQLHGPVFEQEEPEDWAVAQELYEEHLAYRFEHLAVAARSRRASFDAGYDEMGIQTLLPHLAGSLNASRVLDFKTRLDLQHGRTDEAIDNIRIGLRMADHLVHDRAVLVEGLVAAGIQRQMYGGLRQVIEQEEAPNLYWSLVQLPRGLREGHDVQALGSEEAVMFYATVPELHEPADMTERRWRTLVRRVADNFRSTLEAYERNPELYRHIDEENRRALAEKIARIERLADPEKAIRLVREEGTGGEAVDDLPGLAAWIVERYEVMHAQRTAPLGLPANAAVDRLPPQGERDGEEQPLAWLWEEFGDVSWRRFVVGMQSPVRDARMLLAVEAVRDFAAREGRLPESLVELELYVPPDPLTGEPFDYAVEEVQADDGKGRFVLSVPAPADSPPHTGIILRVTMRGLAAAPRNADEEVP